MLLFDHIWTFLFQSLALSTNSLAYNGDPSLLLVDVLTLALAASDFAHNHTAPGQKQRTGL